MSNKEIRLKWLSDDSEIDKSIQSLQQKLVQMNRSSAQMQNITETGSTLSPNAVKAKSSFESSQRAILERERREVDVQQRKEMQHLAQKERALLRLKAIEGDLSKKQQDRIKALEMEVNMSSKTVMDQEATKQQIDTTLNQGKINQGKGSDGGGLVAFVQKLAKNLDPAKIAAAMVGSARVYGQYLGIEQTRDREVQAYRGAQTQAQNIGFQDTMSGKGFMRYFEGEERGKALQMAMAERQKRLSGDPLRAAASIGGQAAMGAVGGFGMLGGPVGAAMGAVGGAGNAIFGDTGVYRQIFDREAYTADVNAQTMQNYRGNIANLRMQDPEKYAAMEQFGKRAGSMQGIQRRMGLSDEEMFGGGFEDITRKGEGEMYKDDPKLATQKGTTVWDASQGKYVIKETDEQILARRGAIDERNKNRTKGFIEGQMTDRAGDRAFSDERIKENMGNIFSAGGSTGFVRQGGAGIAAEYQRAGFTGAAKDMGAISGLGGGAEQTEQQYLKLLSEGVKLGFNASKPSEEMRKFTSIAAQMFRSTGGAEGAVRAFGQGVVGTDMASIEAAQSVYGQLNKEAGQSTGARGAMKQSYLQSSAGEAAFGKVDENTKQMLTEMGLDNLDPDDPTIINAAKQQGVSPEQMVKNLRGMQRYGENLSPETDKKREKFQKAYEKFRGDRKDTGNLKKEFMKGEGADAFNSYLESYGMEREGIGGKSAYEKYALGGAGLGGDLTGLKDKARGIDLTGKGKVLDKGEASTAADQKAQMVVVASNIEKLAEAFSKNATASLDELKAAVKTKDMEEFIKQIEKSDKELAAAIFAAFATSGGNFSMIPKQPNVGTDEEK